MERKLVVDQLIFKQAAFTVKTKETESRSKGKWNLPEEEEEQSLPVAKDKRIQKKARWWTGQNTNRES